MRRQAIMTSAAAMGAAALLLVGCGGNGGADGGGTDAGGQPMSEEQFFNEMCKPRFAPTDSENVELEVVGMTQGVASVPEETAKTNDDLDDGKFHLYDFDPDGSREPTGTEVLEPGTKFCFKADEFEQEIRDDFGNKNTVLGKIYTPDYPEGVWSSLPGAVMAYQPQGDGDYTPVLYWDVSNHTDNAEDAGETVAKIESDSMDNFDEAASSPEGESLSDPNYEGAA